MKKIVDNLKKIDWEEGSAELLSFCLIAPFVIVILYMFINICMHLKTGQIAEYCAYVGGRAAAISVTSNTTGKIERLELAEETANIIVQSVMTANKYKRAETDENGVPTGLYGMTWNGDLTLVDPDGEWVKGELLQYSVTVVAPDLLTNGGGKAVTSSIVMMIESPVEQGYKIDYNTEEKWGHASENVAGGG